MQKTSPMWKWMWEDGGKNLPSADYSGAVASFDNPGYAYPKQITVDIIPVQSGSGDPSPTNVRPISGWTGANVTRTGVNVWDEEWELGGISMNGGAKYNSDTSIRAKNYFSVVPDTQYYISQVSRVTNVHYYDKSKQFISSDNPGLRIFTTPSNCYFMLLSFAVSYGTTYNHDISINYPSTDTQYHAYSGETIEYEFPQEAGTVYGGTLDVTTGLLTVTHGNIASYNGESLPGKWISSMDVYSDGGTPTIGAQVVYELATPITYQLTPTQIALLAGMNNVWADCGDIAVSLESPRDVKLETEAIIAGVEYTDITAPVINRALMQGGLSIGNAVSATCSFSVRNPGTIPKSAEVVIQKRLTDGTQTSEWLTSGTFYISHRQRDPVTGTLELECYDALLKANADMPALMPWTTKGGEPMRTASGELLYFSAHYPRTMAAVMDDIALILGGAIRIDPATQIETGAAYTIDEMQRGTRIVDVLRKIAAANGGNWIMTPENTLRLVPVISAAGAASATANVVDVDGVVGGIGVSNTGTITGIRYTADGGQQVAGDESGIVLDADVSEDVAQALLTKLGGMTYQAYSLSGAVYDPAAELGDYIRAGANGEVSAVIYAETATLGPAFRGNVSAPEIGELADEYPYVGSNAQLLTLAQQYADEAAQQAETNATAAAQEAVTTLDNTLTQQEIFDRLTDGDTANGIRLVPAVTRSVGASTPKRVALDLDYAQYGTISANRVRTGSIESTTGGSSWDLDTGVFVTEDSDSGNGVKIADGQIALYRNGTTVGYIDAQDGWLNIDGRSVILGDVSGNGARVSVTGGEIELYGDIIVSSALPPNTGIDCEILGADGHTYVFKSGILCDYS